MLALNKWFSGKDYAKLSLFLVLFGGGLMFTTAHASALSGSDFNAGRIIDDVVFYNENSMTEAQIQDFLNSKVPTCDTSGSGSYTYRYNSATGRVNFDGSSTEAADPYVTTSRAVYGDRVANYSGDWRGSRAPYTCLKQKTFNTVDIAPESGICNGYVGASNETAARIIYKVAQSCEINPQTLLILLQKEQSLVTDSWPWGIQYDKATGAFCPDSPPAAWAPKNCNPDYLGFPKQVYYGAQRFKVYKANPYNYNYVAGRTNSILWNPNTACGRSDVFIENQATAALYIYTPYRPNSAALNNLYGDGDSCSSYGNRNFWRMWNDWFGSTYGKVDTSGVKVQRDAAGQYFTKDPTKIEFTIKNSTQGTVSYEKIGVAIRGPNNENQDPGWDSNVTLQPGQSYTYSRVVRLEPEGYYKITSSSLEAGVWKGCTFDIDETTCNQTRLFQNPLRVVVNPQLYDVANGSAISTIRQGRTFRATFTIQNTSNTYTVKSGKIMLGSRTSTGGNRDMYQASVGDLAPGAQFTYTTTSKLSDESGTKYTYFTATTKDNGVTYEDLLWQNASPNIGVVTMAPGVAITQGIVSSDPILNGTVNVTMKVKNYQDGPVDIGRIGVSVRGPQGQNMDPLWLRVASLASDDEVVYSASFTPNSVGDWKISYGHTNESYTTWDSAFPLSDSGAINRNVTIGVVDSVVVSQGPTLNISSLHVNQPSVITVKLKNSSQTPIDIGRVGVAVRGPQGQNMDPLWLRVASLASGETVYQAGFIPNASGDWQISFGHTSPDFTKWDSVYPRSESTNVKRSVTVNVKDQVTITEGIAISQQTMGLATITMKLKNQGNNSISPGTVGIGVRDPRGANYDPLWVSPSLAAGETYTYSATVNLDKIGKWSLSVGGNINGKWTNILPASETADIIRSTSVDVH